MLLQCLQQPSQGLNLPFAFKLRAFALDTVSAIAEMSMRVFKLFASMWLDFMRVSFLKTVFVRLKAALAASFVRRYLGGPGS